MPETKPRAEEQLAAGKLLRVVPQGDSMLPLIRPGRDTVYIRSVEPGELHKGDIVLCRSAGQILILHRVSRIRPDGVCTVGDNQLYAEGPFGPGALLGRMETLERDGKRLDAQALPLRLYGRWRLIRRKLILGIKKVLRV